MDMLAAPGEGAMDSVLSGERAALLGQAVETLPLIYREVLGLRFEEDLKLEAIADLLGVPLSTVKSRLRRALEELRTMLTDQLKMGLPHERTP